MLRVRVGAPLARRSEQRSECLKVRQKKTATGKATVMNQYNLFAVYPSFIWPVKNYRVCTMYVEFQMDS